MKKIELVVLTLSVLFGFKQKSQENTRRIFLGDGREVNAPPKPDRICLAYSVFPEERMNQSDWVTYVKLRPDVDCEGSVITKYYL
jgi:hypothetical protein